MSGDLHLTPVTRAEARDFIALGHQPHGSTKSG